MSAFFTSCQKSTVKPSDSVDIITGKWRIKNLVTKYTYSNKNLQDEYVGESVDSFYFVN